MTERQFVAVYIPGRPIAKGRPRFSQGSRGVQVFTPERTENWESVVQAAMREACSEPLVGPLMLSATFNFQCPKNWPKAKRQAIEEGELLWHDKKPDLDNLVKLVKDAGNGILWRDDAQVVSINCDKSYAAESGTIIDVHSAPE